MTDQVKAIRAEIERRIHSIEKCPFIIAELGAKEREIGEVMAYKDILALIDSLPDEPASEDDKDMIESIEMWLHEIEPKWVEKELAWLGDLRTRLAEEPVTDCHELEEAAENPYVLNDVSHAAFEYERTRNDLDARSDNEVVRRAFIAGANWQKDKDTRDMYMSDNRHFQKFYELGKKDMKDEFEKNRLAACDSLTKEEYDREMDFTTKFIEEHHRTPTFSDAINYGMKLQKEQMMKEDEQ